MTYKSCPQFNVTGGSKFLLGVVPFYAKDRRLEIAQSWIIKSIDSKGLRGRKVLVA